MAFCKILETPDRPNVRHLLDCRHPLVRLAAVIDWQEIERTFGVHFASNTGRPALLPRHVAGLLYLQHAYDCSDEAAVNTWVENSYRQCHLPMSCRSFATSLHF